MGLAALLTVLIAVGPVYGVKQQGQGGLPCPSDNENGPALQREYAPDLQGENGPSIWFEYGMNLGFYFAHSSTANYYNGQGGGSGGRRSLEQVMRTDLNYNRIRQDLGYDFSLHALPMDMRYSPSILLGFFGSLHFGPRSALVADFNYTKLRLEDQFTLLLERFSNIEGDNIERFTITGSEERVDLRLGYQHTFLSRESYIHPYLEAGFSLTDTKVKEIRTQIRNSTYSLFHASTTQYTLERDFGMSAGGYAGIGLKMDVNENFRLTVGYASLYTQINLGENDESRFQHSIFVRLNLDGLFNRTPTD
jgi:hypothetical protein